MRDFDERAFDDWRLKPICVHPETVRQLREYLRAEAPEPAQGNRATRRGTQHKGKRRGGTQHKGKLRGVV